MLRFDVITLFPELIDLYTRTSIIGRGITAEKIGVATHNPRDFCLDKYKKVDDSPYGGGAGMVLKPEPFFATFESIERPPDAPVILVSPQGIPFNSNMAETLSKEKQITFFCGHYEGFDERIATLATHEVSIGDFVITGGELAALIIIDAVSRFVPGVVGKHASVLSESFSNGLLEGPSYTKPPEFRGMNVPDVLLSGNHKLIERWRRQESLRRTYERRPDLLEHAKLNREDLLYIEELKKRSGA